MSQSNKQKNSVEAIAQRYQREILEELSTTLFACTRLTPLPAGTTNFVFRGTLEEPFSLAVNDPRPLHNKQIVSTVIIKHLESFARLNPALHIDGQRAPFESFMLGILEDFDWRSEQFSSFEPSNDPNQGLQAPRLLHTNQSKNTFVIEDLGSETVDLKEQLLGANTSDPVIARKLGKDLGGWLKAFHQWTTKPAQNRLVERMREYEEMSKFKRLITYHNIPKWCESSGLLDDNTRAMFLEVDNLVAKESSDTHSRQMTDEWGPVHADFWTGNILCPPSPDLVGNPGFAVVDWEFAQLAPRAYDLGQMIGDLIELYQKTNLDVFLHTLDSFVEGYGAISREMAFRVLIHAGAHLIGWFVRGSGKVRKDGDVHRIVKLGRDMICYGIRKDDRWFRDNHLGAIFDQESSSH
ncbi:putative Kinase-like domain-containing protein [Seiridium cardinale]